MDRARVLRVALQLAVSAAFLGVLLWRTDLSGIGAALRAADWRWAALAVPMLAVIKATQGLRWWLIVRRAGAVPARDCMLLVAAAAGVGVMLPLRAGTALQVQVLHRRYGVQRAAIAGTLMLEGLLDALTLLLLAAFAAPLLGLGGLISPRALAVSAVIIATVAAGAAAVTWRSTRARLAPFVPRRVRQTVERETANLAKGFAAAGSARLVAVLVALTFANWLLSASALSVVGRGFGLGVPAYAYLGVEIVGNLSSAVPLTQENIGPYELAVRETLVALGAQGSPAAFAIAAHATSIAATALAGLGALWALRLRRTDVFFWRADGSVAEPPPAAVPPPAPAP